MENKKLSTKSKKIQNIILIITSIVITIYILCLIGSFVKISGKSINDIIIYKLWKIKVKLFGNSEIGIWQNDPILGWAHKPNSSGKHFSPPNFNVTYHIDKNGNRFTPGEDSLPKIVFLGGSWTFGHGVEDNETYPSIIQARYPQYKVVNAGCMGWGTCQGLLKLQEELASNKDIKLVIYGFLNNHLRRNYLRKTWLKRLFENIKRENPYFEIVEEKLVFKGLADPDKDGIEDEKYLEYMEKKITILMLIKMKKLCDAHSVPFIFIYLPYVGKDEFDSDDILPIVGDDFFCDLRKNIEHSDIRFKFDGHPNPNGHRIIAKFINPVIEKILLKD